MLAGSHPRPSGPEGCALESWQYGPAFIGKGPGFASAAPPARWRGRYLQPTTQSGFRACAKDHCVGGRNKVPHSTLT